MIKKEKIAIVAGIGAVIVIGITFLSAVGLGKNKGAEYLKKGPYKKSPQSQFCDWAFLFLKICIHYYNY